MVERMDDDLTTTREQVFTLMAKKNSIENELAQLKEILEMNSVGMNDPLVDNDGYPRNDIDVFLVRHTRHKIICLQNDHKDLMSKIETGLHSIHQLAASDQASTSQTETVNYSPIARVSVVQPNSPAQQAGLEEEDEVLQFGSVNSANFGSLKDIASVVRHSVNQRVMLTVRRGDAKVRIALTPKPWPGRGLLGCLILPIEEPVDR